jgi:hypothetical protein
MTFNTSAKCHKAFCSLDSFLDALVGFLLTPALSGRIVLDAISGRCTIAAYRLVAQENLVEQTLVPGGVFANGIANKPRSTGWHGALQAGIIA